MLRVVSMGSENRRSREVGNYGSTRQASTLLGGLNVCESCGWSEFWVLEQEALDISVDIRVALRRLQADWEVNSLNLSPRVSSTFSKIVPQRQLDNLHSWSSQRCSAIEFPLKRFLCCNLLAGYLTGAAYRPPLVVARLVIFKGLFQLLCEA